MDGTLGCDSGMIPPPVPNKANVYIPPLTEYEIHIKFLNRGCVVSVGCKSIAFDCVDEMLTNLVEYVRNHEASYKKWTELFNQ